MKKIIISALSLICMIVVGLMVACGKEEPATLTLNKTIVSVEKYDNAWLIPEYDGTKELVWSSEDSSIATVVSGKISAVGVGETKIIVTDGTVKAECSVSVKEADLDKLALSVEQNSNVYLGEQTGLKAWVTYDNIPVSSASLSYSTQNENIIIDDFGVITANALGEASVSIFSVVEGKELSATVQVNVINAYALNIEQKNVVLYPVSEYNGKTYNKTIECTAVVTEKGKEISIEETGVIWTVPTMQDIISVDEKGLVTALNGGEATLTASYTLNGMTIFDEMTVTVATVDTKVQDAVLHIGLVSKFTPNLKELVGADVEVSKLIVDATGVEGVEVFPEIDGFDMSQFSSGAATVTCVTRNYSYTFDADICDGVIQSVEDMKLLLNATEGVYKIVADIDMSKYTDNNGVWTSTAKFKGTIDGLGHTISNFKTNSGLFLQFNGGIVKNIAFTNVQTQGAGGVICNGFNRNASKAVTIENLYIHITAGDGWYIGVMGNVNLKDTFTMKDSVIVSDVSTAAVLGRVGSRAITMLNCHLINVKGYVQSLNTALSKQEQQELHLPATNTATSYVSQEMAYVAYLSGKIVLPDMVKKFFVDDMSAVSANITTISTENVADLLSITSGIVLLEEDIDMATAYTESGGVWTSTVEFNGTIVGNGHTISNFKTNTGLFKNFNGGSILDVAFTAVQAQGDIGVFGNYNRGKGKAIVFENVLVQITSTTGLSYVGLIGNANLMEDITMTNCVVVSDFTGTAQGAIVGKIGSKAVKMANCYLVNTKGYVESLNTALTQEAQVALHLPSTNTATTFADKAAFISGCKSGNVSGLATFIQNLVADWM